MPIHETLIVDFSAATTDERQRMLDAIVARRSCRIDVERDQDVLHLGSPERRQLQRAANRATIAVLILVAVVVFIQLGRWLGAGA